LLGCKPAGTNWDIFGIWRFYELFDHALKDAIPLYGKNLFLRHGRNTVPVVDLGRPAFVTMEPKNVQYLLSNLKEYGLSSARDHFHYFIGRTGIFTADGEAWQQSRALVKPSFTKTQIADFELLEENIQELFVAMDQLTDPEGVVAMKPLFNDLTMDFASVLLFGRTAHALKQRREGKSEEGLAYAFDRGMLHVTYSWILGTLHWFWRPAEFRRCRKTVHQYVDGFIAEALEKRQEGESEKERVLREGGRYVFLNALTGISQDPEMLRAQVLSIMLAGRDTTAALVSWIMWVLSREKVIWERLQQEVKANLGTGAESRLPTWQELKDMKYLQAIIHEGVFPSLLNPLVVYKLT
jgi:cytochrome P450